jgi:DNA-binding beta-propeller fold protein YncE
MKKILFLVIILLTGTLLRAQTVVNTPAPKLLWQTSDGLNVPESVFYNPDDSVLYVSNVAGSPALKDSNGYISRLSADGKVLDAKWVTGLDAPKGMGIKDKHLFVTNINELVEIDIATATIVKRYPVTGSRFLNDVAVDPATGLIFITDTDPGAVYVMQNSTINKWLDDPMFASANGLYVANGFLYLGAGNNVQKINILTGEMQIFLPRCGSVDGLYADSDGNLFFSDWVGNLRYSDRNSKITKLLSLKEQKLNIADFAVIPEKKQIILPTFGGNSVQCYLFPMVK